MIINQTLDTLSVLQFLNKNNHFPDMVNCNNGVTTIDIEDTDGTIQTLIENNIASLQSPPQEPKTQLEILQETVDALVIASLGV